MMIWIRNPAQRQKCKEPWIKSHSHVIKVSKLTPNVFVRGELGRYTNDNIRTEILVKYWLKLLYMPNERLPKMCYNLQCRWLEANPRTKCWAKDVKRILYLQGVWDDGMCPLGMFYQGTFNSSSS